jgi:DNA-binding MarR family transcriptional regulator
MIFQDGKIIQKFGSLLFNFNIIVSSILKEQKDPKISLNQFRTLNIIRLKNNITAVEIADILSITPASMAKNIELLVNYGFINQVENKDDKRQKKLKITLKGKLKVASIGKQIADKLAPAKKVLTQEERNILLELLTKIDEVINQ